MSLVLLLVLLSILVLRHALPLLAFGLARRSQSRGCLETLLPVVLLLLLVALWLF